MSFLIRFRYLSAYKSLYEPPLERPSALELHPDVNKTEEPSSFHNYLDEFLQAVRVFGFLEKPVFHELARHLQTRRLIAGDTLSLDSDKSFYCVVDGNVQVFAPPTTSSGQLGPSDDDASWGSDMNGYQLLNDVGSGGTLSSLFTILSLFTENIQLRWSDDYMSSNVILTPPSSALSQPLRSRPRRRNRFNSDVSHLDIDSLGDYATSSHPVVRRTGSIVSSHSSSASTVHGVPGESLSTAPKHVSPTVGDTEPDWATETWSPPSESPPGTPSYRGPKQSSEYFGTPHPPPPKSHHSNAPQQGIIARAMVDTTLAVIPAEAFQRLTQKFPKASAHIVQGQLFTTCISRVADNLHSDFNPVFSGHLPGCTQISWFDIRIVENRKSYQ